MFSLYFFLTVDRYRHNVYLRYDFLMNVFVIMFRRRIPHEGFCITRGYTPTTHRGSLMNLQTKGRFHLVFLHHFLIAVFGYFVSRFSLYALFVIFCLFCNSRIRERMASGLYKVMKTFSLTRKTSEFFLFYS